MGLVSAPPRANGDSGTMDVVACLLHRKEHSPV